MLEIITTQDIRLLRWAEEKLETTWETSKARWLAGIDSEVRFVVVYSRFSERECWMSIAANGNWATKRSLRAIFSLPFVQWKLKRLTFLVKANNTKSLKMMRQAGAVEEGRARKCFEGDIDGIVFGMLPDECKWIGEKNEQGR